MKRYIRATTENHDLFKMTTTTSYYDNFLNDKDLEYMRKSKNRDGKIVMMTPDEYYEESAKLFGTSKENLVNQRSNQYTDQYVQDMLDGAKFPLPYLNYAENTQEGLHRMLAAKRAFGADVKYPVLVVTVYDDEVECKENQWKKFRTFCRNVFDPILNDLETHLSHKYHFPPENLAEIAESYINGELEYYYAGYDDSDGLYDVDFDCKVESSLDGGEYLAVYVTEFDGQPFNPPRQMLATGFDELFDYDGSATDNEGDGYTLSDEEIDELIDNLDDDDLSVDEILKILSKK